MSMSKHKNIVEEYISFVDFNYLWIVMPLIGAGSVVDVMRQVRPSNQPGIQDEAIIATIMKETLEGLLYLHSNR
jgi:serine/threonine-protein kinase OSR1/STK39